MTKSLRRPGPESTLDDVRAKLIEAAIDLLRERGVEVGLDDVSLSAAIKAAGVTRTTAYRSLADPELAPQAALHRELLTYLLTRYNRGLARTTIEEAVAIELDRVSHCLASDDIAVRTRALRGVIRVGANASYQAVVDSPERSILTAIYAALRSSGASDWRLYALRQGELALTDMFAGLYQELADSFGYRVRPEFTMHQLATAGAALMEGMALRQGINDELTMIRRATGEHGGPEEWSLFGIGLESLLVGMCEPDDPQTPFADLANY